MFLVGLKPLLGKRKGCLADDGGYRDLDPVCAPSSPHSSSECLQQSYLRAGFGEQQNSDALPHSQVAPWNIVVLECLRLAILDSDNRRHRTQRSPGERSIGRQKWEHSMTPSEFHLNRRSFLTKSGTAAAPIGLGDTWPNFLRAQAPERSIDHTIRIGPVSLELAPGKIVKTTGYNGTVPGPVLRLREGKPVVHQRHKRLGYPNPIHWHGLLISLRPGWRRRGRLANHPPRQSRVYSFTPKLVGTRWYHSHAMAGTDLTEHLFRGVRLPDCPAGHRRPWMLRPRNLLAAHHWEGEWVSMQDIRKGPPPDNGLEVMYKGATLNDRMLGHEEPIRVSRASASCSGY